MHFAQVRHSRGVLNGNLSIKTPSSSINRPEDDDYN